MKKPIDSFSGEYRFLSNFFLAPVSMDGIIYPSVEHAYVAAKTLDIEKRLKILEMKTLGTVKRYGRQLKLREDWEEVKVGIMRSLVAQKFARSPLKGMLLETGDSPLIEGNTWGDTFWGVCKGKGLNTLGMILMEVRNDMKKR